VSKYKIAEIAVELKEDGEYVFWCYNLGFHPGQGGMEFCYGNFGTINLEKSLDILKEKLVKDIDTVLAEVRAKVEKSK
jgi:hypothetical protein